MTQESLLEKYKKVSEAVEESWTGLITKVVEVTNTDYYGEEGIYGEKQGIAIYVKLNSPNGEEFDIWYNIPTALQGIVQSNIYKFEEKYGKIPEKGMEVDVVLNENGFFEIVI